MKKEKLYKFLLERIKNNLLLEAHICGGEGWKLLAPTKVEEKKKDSKFEVKQCSDNKWYFREKSTTTTTTDDTSTTTTTTTDDTSSSEYKNVDITGEDILLRNKLVKKGMKGDIVGKIQERLKHHGFPNFSKSGKIDKLFGILTKKMIKEFQKSKDLNDDGVVGPKTWTELVKDKTSPTPVTPVIPITPITPPPDEEDDSESVFIYK